MNEKKKKNRVRILCLVLAAALLTSFKFFSLYSKERDSEYYVNSMISASYLGKQIPGPFGLILLRSEGVVFSGESGGNEENSALYIAYHPEDFDRDAVEINTVRLQQLGLQGWIAYGAGSLCRSLHLPAQAAYYLLRLLNALLFSLTLLGISWQLKKAYNALFAIVFYLVCLLSSWIDAFACNLYWMSFSWFLPMLFGLMILNHPQRRGWLYLLIAASVALKCSFGYEYVTNVMIGPVFFLGVEWLCAVKERTGRARLLFRCFVGAGLASFAGFAATICLHAWLRTGSVYGGLVDIVYCDVLRRTVGDPVITTETAVVTVKTSVWAVLARYWLLSVTGLLATGTLAANLVLFLRSKNRSGLFRDAVMLLAGALAASSWFVLAKSHSYVHHHLNGVLFYLPFMQISVYILVKQLLRRLAVAGKTSESRLSDLLGTWLTGAALEEGEENHAHLR